MGWLSKTDRIQTIILAGELTVYSDHSKVDQDIYVIF